MSGTGGSNRGKLWSFLHKWQATVGNRTLIHMGHWINPTRLFCIFLRSQWTILQEFLIQFIHITGNEIWQLPSNQSFCRGKVDPRIVLIYHWSCKILGNRIADQHIAHDPAQQLQLQLRQSWHLCITVFCIWLWKPTSHVLHQNGFAMLNWDPYTMEWEWYRGAGRNKRQLKWLSAVAAE